MRSTIGSTLLALAAAAAFAPATLAQQQGPQLGGIESQELRQLDAWTVGALSRNQGALNHDLWRGADARVLSLLFERLPAVYESPAAQALARRVLLSGADAPAGDGGGDAGDASAGAARKRFEALGKMGAADDLAVMGAGAGPSLNDPAIAQFAAQAELARGHRTEACARGRAPTMETPAPFILRLRAYCAATAGDRAAADLALELARASGADDAWVTAAVAAAAGAPGARPPAARYDNSLTVQLSIAAHLRPGPNPLTNASTLALVALARNEASPQPQRAQAAALAFRRGALAPGEARAILHATPAEIVSALAPIALALRQVEATPDSLPAAAAIADVLRQASAPADFHAAALFFKSDIAALTAAPDAAATMLFARAAISAGDADLATRLAQSAHQAGIEQTAMASVDAALAVLTNARGADAAMAVTRRIDAAGASLARGASRDLVILAAAGFPLDGAAKGFLLANPPQGGVRAEPGAAAALAAGGERSSVGEAALLAIIASGEGPARLDADGLDRILRTLNRRGLTEDARAFAIEALLAGQPSS